MILTEKNYKILALRCLHATFASKLATGFSLFKNTLNLKETNLIIMYLLKMLENYNPFESKIYNAQEITFVRSNEGEFTVTINIDGDIYSYTGSGDEVDLNYYFANLINLNQGKYIAYATNGALYLYTYYSLETFSDIPTITITNSDITNTQTLLSFSIDSLEDSQEILLNLWNCITEEDFCKIEKKITNLMCC